MSALPLFQLDAAANADRHAARVSLSPEARAALTSIGYTSDKYGKTLILPRLAAKVYAEVDRFFRVIGVRWESARQRHTLPDGAAAAIVEAVTSGSYVDTVRELEFFPTSVAYATQLAAELENEIGFLDAPRLLEPSAGDGVMVAALRAAMPHAHITAIELDRVRARELQRRFADDPAVTILTGSMFEHDGRDYDGILMNPPFSEALAHTQHARTLLRRGGALVGIGPIGIRDMAVGRWIHGVDALIWRSPADAFSTTTVASLSYRLRNCPSTHELLVAELATIPGTTAALIEALEEKSRALHRLAEDWCNGDIQEPEVDVARESHTRELDSWLTPLGIRYELAGDPRAGYGFRLIVPSGRTNDFARSGIVVPNAYDPARDICD